MDAPVYRQMWQECSLEGTVSTMNTRTSKSLLRAGITIAILVLPAVATVAAATTTSAPAADLAATWTDPAAWQTDHAQEREEFEKRIARRPAGLDKAAARLQLANWWLATPTSSPATRWLLGFDSKADRETISAAGKSAREQIEQAMTELDQVKKDNLDDAGRRRKRDLQNEADVLDAFGAVFEMANRPAEGDEAQAQWKKVSRGLAVARESEKADLAAAALLWHVFTLDKAGNRDRAMEALPDGMARPERLPYDIIARLLRGRLLANAGEYAASVALAARVQTQTKAWIDSAQREKVRRLAALLQHEVTDQWIEELMCRVQKAAAQPLRATLPELAATITETKASETPEFYALKTAVPMLRRPVLIDPAEEDTTTMPADGANDSTDDNAAPAEKPATAPQE